MTGPFFLYNLRISDNKAFLEAKQKKVAYIQPQKQHPRLSQSLQSLKDNLKCHHITFQTKKTLSSDPYNCLLPPGSILTKKGTPFRNFAQFYKAAKKELDESTFFFHSPSLVKDSSEHKAHQTLKSFVKNKLKKYEEEKDFPSLDATSHLSSHLHYGEISIERVYKETHTSESFCRELFFREFAYHTYHFFPHMDIQPLQDNLKGFPWKKSKVLFEKWKKGETGVPIVDAGMRELFETGWISNRMRMIVASFLVKDLHIPWQQGAEWFMERLIDGDLAINSFNWQWVAGCGIDPVPYFRIFNPYLQSKKYDPDNSYIKKWVPALEKNYPKQVVEHSIQRKKFLAFFKQRK